MPSVLFVCTANRYRSPLAAAIFRNSLEESGLADSWRISSAGTWATPGQPVLPLVSKVALEHGLDLSHHRSERLSYRHILDYDLVLVMQAGQKEALVNEFPAFGESIYLLSAVCERREYDIPDALDSAWQVAEVLRELDSLIRRGLESICVLAAYLSNTKRSAV